MHTSIPLFGLAKMQATTSPTQASERYDVSPGLASVYYTCTVPDPTRETARDSVSSTVVCSRTRSRQGILPWYSRSSRSFPCACAWTRYIRSPLSSVSSPRLRHRSTDTAHRTRTRLESVGPAPTISRPLREVLCRMLQ
jgi:hypothetical protein